MSHTQIQDPLFREDGPINPDFTREATRALLRTLPLDDPAEPKVWALRRMSSAVAALSALRPRDEIEVMLGVQAIAAYHAAGACWHLGMNSKRPRGDSTRHITAAATAARTFDTLLKALERRQAKPLAPPVEPPAPQAWPKSDPAEFIQALEDRYRQDSEDPAPRDTVPAIVWTPEDVAAVERLREEDRIAKENEGLDLANTEGILPGGGMIMPEHPTPQQEAYLGRRLRLMYQREYEDNVRRGINKFPETRPLRIGDFVP